MEYVKKGHIFNPQGNYDWMDGYVCPSVSILFPDFIRIYFSTRSKKDAQGNFTTYTSYMDCDKNDPSKILYLHDRPILELGLPGTFDEHGTMLSEVVMHNGRYLLYYMGWQRSVTVPYLIRVGLATSDDGVHFTKVSDGPIIGISRFLPFGIGNVSVVVEGDTFHMWYTQYLQWIETPNGYRPTYDIRYASSKNGMDWEFGEPCITSTHDNESIATPCVRKIAGKYRMWYSYRPAVDDTGKSGAYSIGYAESDDKLHWERKDEQVTVAPSSTGWDSEMVCYPDVLQVDSRIFLFYGGNRYGQDGIGYAEIFNINE